MAKVLDSEHESHCDAEKQQHREEHVCDFSVLNDLSLFEAAVLDGERVNSSLVLLSQLVVPVQFAVGLRRLDVLLSRHSNWLLNIPGSIEWRCLRVVLIVLVIHILRLIIIN